MGGQEGDIAEGDNEGRVDPPLSSCTHSPQCGTAAPHAPTAWDCASGFFPVEWVAGVQPFIPSPVHPIACSAVHSFSLSLCLVLLL